MSCVTSVEYKVVMKGEVTYNFSHGCGIRQGDHISLYIYILCMEKLSYIINCRVMDKSWKTIKVSRRGPYISHLFFADDFILLGQATADQASVMKDCIDMFCNCLGQENRRPIYLINWKTVCLPKYLGGLGVKQMEPLNQALLAKLSWRLLHGEDSLWCSMIEAKYLGNRTAVSRNGGCRSSTYWRSINHGFNLLKKCLVWRVGDGTSISFWNDSWVPDLLEKVCSFFCEEGWNYDKLNLLLPSHIVQKIISIHIGRESRTCDKVTWGLTKDGSFNVKSAYIANLDIDNCVKWSWSFI
ncbi:hypothetical protein ACOSQ3_012875 [Xanthoceras sorbifolium]